MRCAGCKNHRFELQTEIRGAKRRRISALILIVISLSDSMYSYDIQSVIRNLNLLSKAIKKYPNNDIVSDTVSS